MTGRRRRFQVAKMPRAQMPQSAIDAREEMVRDLTTKLALRSLRVKPLAIYVRAMTGRGQVLSR